MSSDATVYFSKSYYFEYISFEVCYRIVKDCIQRQIPRRHRTLFYCHISDIHFKLSHLNLLALTCPTALANENVTIWTSTQGKRLAKLMKVNASPDNSRPSGT